MNHEISQGNYRLREREREREQLGDSLAKTRLTTATPNFVHAPIDINLIHAHTHTRTHLYININTYRYLYELRNVNRNALIEYTPDSEQDAA